jgi:hypothetical protein
MNHQAIYNLYPNVVSIDETAGAMDKDGNPVSIKQSRYDVEVLRLQAEYEAKEYSRLRASAYASVEEQMDMQYHDSLEGTSTWQEHINAVKEAYPK